MTVQRDQDIEIAVVAKNSRERVRVALKRYNGHPLIDLRVFFASSSGDFLPSGKGVSVNVDRLAELRQALEQAEKRARELGWLKAAE